MAITSAELLKVSIVMFFQYIPLKGSTTSCLLSTPYFVWSENLLRVNLILTFRLLINTLHDTNPIHNLWGVPLVTDLQLDFVPLVTTLWAWQLGQLSAHLTIYSSSLYFTSLFMRVSGESVSKVLLNSWVNTVHWAGCVAVECYQAGWGWLPLHKTMLTTSNHLLVLHSFGNVWNGFQDYFTPSPSQESRWGLILLLALHESMTGISFLPALRNLPQRLWPLKGNGDWFCNTVNQFPQH